MPLVTVYYRSEEILEKLNVEELSLIASNAFNKFVLDEEVKLEPSDIEIIFSSFGHYDKTKHEIIFVIMANKCRRRSFYLKEIREEITEKITLLLSPTNSFFVWLLLVEGSFAEV